MPLTGLDELCSSALLWLCLTTSHFIPAYILFQLTCLSVVPIECHDHYCHITFGRSVFGCMLTHFNDVLAYS